ncbi:hypothetical protein GCM10009555_012700 [Acrocarpospora macrocephala]|uniref:Uncharacterized protein n=1 Tax=Acrocarpospora macrocephala TaxID=150177 RepID=A0A5M3WIT2_9ACTN|nr:hypothetical protein [Acrocarpospora macrocephala]GES08079.1 hypothetical protein Amac_016740 [Acrocarpospora macrocephala]
MIDFPGAVLSEDFGETTADVEPSGWADALEPGDHMSGDGRESVTADRAMHAARVPTVGLLLMAAALLPSDKGLPERAVRAKGRVIA